MEVNLFRSAVVENHFSHFRTPDKVPAWQCSLATHARVSLLPRGSPGSSATQMRIPSKSPFAYSSLPLSLPPSLHSSASLGDSQIGWHQVFASVRYSEAPELISSCSAFQQALGLVRPLGLLAAYAGTNGARFMTPDAEAPCVACLTVTRFS